MMSATTSWQLGRSILDRPPASRNFRGKWSKPAIHGYWRQSICRCRPGFWQLSFLNEVFLLLLTALVWIASAGALNDGSFGRWLSAGTVFLTPLWFYAFFILKDRDCAYPKACSCSDSYAPGGGGPLRAWLLTGASAFALLPLRSPLLLQDMGVAIGAVTARLMAPGRIWRRLAALVVGLPAMGALLLVASDPDG